jgi:hypothetical protein
MAQVFNLFRVSSTSAGTGPATLGPAISGFLTFSGAGGVDGTVVEYSINDGANSEKGSGPISGGILTRQNIYSSTNAGAAIALSGLSSTCNVFCDPSAQNLWSINTAQHAAYGGV